MGSFFGVAYGTVGLPETDLVIYMDMQTEITEQMMRQREQNTGTQADIHEQDETYLKNCRANAKEIVKECGWSVLNCAKNGSPRTPDDIHAQVYRLVKKLLQARRVPGINLKSGTPFPASHSSAPQQQPQPSSWS